MLSLIAIESQSPPEIIPFRCAYFYFFWGYALSNYLGFPFTLESLDILAAVN